MADPSSTVEESGEKHPVRVLLFDSELPENKVPHLKIYGDATSNYDFTVKQRLLAKDAKIPETIQELESSESLY